MVTLQAHEAAMARLASSLERARVVLANCFSQRKHREPALLLPLSCGSP